MQFRISELLIVIAVAAFGITCLVNATSLTETCFVNFTHAIFFIAIVFAIGRKNGQRAFWSGFLATSLLYTGFSLIPDSRGFSPRMNGSEITTKSLNVAYAAMQTNFKSFHISQTEEFQAEIEATSDSDENPFADGGTFCIQESGVESEQDFEPLIELIKDTVDPDAWEETGDSGTIMPFPSNITCMIPNPSSDKLSFVAIGHSMWALLLGLIGGHGSRFVCEYSRKNPWIERSD